MKDLFPQPPRQKRRLLIKDNRGMPAHRVPLKLAGKRFKLIKRLTKNAGVCVLTEKGKPVLVAVRLDQPHVVGLIEALSAMAVLRRRNPGGVFTLADEVFGAASRADWWMAQQNWSMAGGRPAEKLATVAGVEAVLTLLHQIRHGVYV